jgi:hypothetical protein
VLALALLAMLGHVCALPHDAHAGGDEPSGHHDSHDHDGASPHDALHSASCEAVRSSVTPSAPIVNAAGVPVATMPLGMEHRETAGRPFAIMTSPPLFLLHSALRI